MAIDPRQLAINRRMRGLLPADDLLAITQQGALPGAHAVPASTGPFLSPGDPGFAEAEAAIARRAAAGTGPFADVPEEELDPTTQQVLAGARGTALGQEAVARRLAAQQAAGLGQFVDPSTGRPADFGSGRFLTNPALFLAPGFGRVDELQERASAIQDAVRRRLEELMAGAGGTASFASPSVAPPILRRGRFGT